MAKNSRRKLIVRFAVIAVLVYVGILLVQQEVLLRSQAGEQRRLQDQLQQAIDQQETIKGQLDHADTPESIMKIVREKLGWVAPDEILFVEDEPPGAGATPTPSPEPPGE